MSEQTLAFLDLIAAEGVDGLIHVACNEPDTNIWPSRYFQPDQKDAAIAYVRSENMAGRNLYVSPALMKPTVDQSRPPRNADVQSSRVAFVDIDEKEAAEAFEDRSAGFPPSVVVQTGSVPHRRLHAYWAFDEPAEPELLAEVQAALIAALGADKAVKDVRRVMAFPGTLKRPKKDKRDRGYADESVEVVTRREVFYTVEDLLASLPSKKNEAEAHVAFDADAIVERMKATKEGGEWHASLYELIGHYVRNSSTDEEMLALAERIEQSGYSREQTLTDIRAAIAFCRKKETEKPLTNKTSIEIIARAFVADVEPIYWRQSFLTFNGKCWSFVDDDQMRNQIYWWLKGCQLSITPRRVSDVLRLAKDEAHRDFQDLPTWEGKPLCSNPLAVKNGIVDLDTGKLHPHTRSYINVNFSDFEYDVNVGAPTEFMRFLESVFPNDQECIDAVQMWFGYLLSTDTSMQKILQLVGPPRSGKGVLARVFAKVVGEHNCCAPALAALAKDHTLETAVGKKAMLISEARIGRVDRPAITSSLLNISGQDPVAINPKYKSMYTTTLYTRIIIQSNDVLELPDDSSALTARLLVIPTTISHVGKEDRKLEARLDKEIGAILRWAIDGFRMLKERGGDIPQPKAGLAKLKETSLATSPLKVFLDDLCVLEPDAYIPKQELWANYLEWGKASNQKTLLTQSRFFSLLKNNHGLTDFRPRQDGDRLACLKGIGWRDASTEGRPVGSTGASNVLRLQAPM